VDQSHHNVVVRTMFTAAAFAIGLSGCSASLESTGVDTPITALTAVSPSVAPEPTRPRVLLVGDSTLRAVDRYDTVAELQGFDWTLETASCRTLGVPSCGDAPRPPNTVETILASDGPWDIIVVMAGYDEWWTSFPDSVREVAEASRQHGARTLLVLNFREGVGYVAPDGRTATEAFERNNATLREFTESGEIPELVVGDWYGYTSGPKQDGWLQRDGIHLTRRGASAVAAYISRWVAHLSRRPCPSNASETAVCANPDVEGPPA
jgi:hypothetical protein